MDIAKNTVAIVLAAGKSERLGEPKALLNFGKGTLIKFIVDRLEKLNLEVIVVTNSKIGKDVQDCLILNSAKIIIPNNVDNRTGNLISGILASENPERALVVPIDRPGWSLDTVKVLLRMNITCCPKFQEKGGHPLLICKNDIIKLISSNVEKPLNSIFQTKKINVNDVNLHLNIDTQEDIAKLKKFMDEIKS